MKNILTLRFLVLTVMVLAAALSRILPHPPNFAPIAAMALFGGCYFNDKRLAFAVPLMAMVASDIFIGFHPLVPYIYASFIFITFIGLLLKRHVHTLNIIAACLAGSVIFFLVSNFGVWISPGGYENNFSGLIQCYTMAIPFFRNTVLGDLVYGAILFGGFELAQTKFPMLNKAQH